MIVRTSSLFSDANFDVEADTSWVLVLGFAFVSMSFVYFPELYPMLPMEAHLWMSLSVVVGFVGSLFLHEVGHVLVARRNNVCFSRIQMFVFGGVHRMRSEPVSPQIEAKVALGGLAVSLLLSLAIFALPLVAGSENLAPALASTLRILGWLNLLLVVVNLIPAYPLDGGHLLRAALWRINGDLESATKVTVNTGRVASFFLFGVGVFLAMAGSWVVGAWAFVFGFFLRMAADKAYQELRVRHILQEESIQRIMEAHPITIPAGMNLEQAVSEYFEQHEQEQFPVMDGGKLVGYINRVQIDVLPSDEWSRYLVQDVAKTSDRDATTTPDANAWATLRAMMERGQERLYVTEGQKLLGVVSRRNLARFVFLQLKVEATTS